jgi:hypothetical protein
MHLLSLLDDPSSSGIEVDRLGVERGLTASADRIKVDKARDFSVDVRCYRPAIQLQWTIRREIRVLPEFVPRLVPTISVHTVLDVDRCCGMWHVTGTPTSPCQHMPSSTLNYARPV